MAQNYEDENLEYQLNDDDNVVYDQDEHAAGADSAEGLSVVKKSEQRSKKHMILMIIFLILIALVGYKLYSLIAGGMRAVTGLQSKHAIIKPASSAATTKNTASETAATDNSAVDQLLQGKNASGATTTSPTSGSSSVNTAPVPPVSNVDAAQLTSLQQSQQQLLEQQQTNAATLTTLQGSIGDLQTGLGGLQTTIKTLSTQVQQTQSAQKAAELKQQQKAQMQTQLMRRDKNYFVHAVIPGRAWLSGEDGTAVTVTIGDLLPGYGKVTAIDPYSGMVQTSSGVNIYYGISDN